MTLKNYFLHQLAEEVAVTRKMLALVPEDKYQWQPHPKSMTLIRLAVHLAELGDWVPSALKTDGLDFATGDYAPKDVNNNEELMAYFEETTANAVSALNETPETEYEEIWTMRNGEQIYIRTNKADVLRMSFSQMIHHRAQLGVFLRLLNIPIPGSYGPSADEMGLFEDVPAEVKA